LILTIGAIDSSGGAGLDQDRRTAERLGSAVRAAVTGVTAQGKEGVLAIHPVPSDLFRIQLETHWEEDSPDAVKIGALCETGQIALLADLLSLWKKRKPRLRIVTDPVFAPTRGLPFLPGSALSDYTSLLDCSDVITPNRGELELLSGFPVATPAQGIRAARELAERHRLSVALTGGHFPGVFIEEYLVGDEVVSRFRKPRTRLRESHGTGCCFATALAVYLARGKELPRAFRRATGTVSRQMGWALSSHRTPFRL